MTDLQSQVRDSGGVGQWSRAAASVLAKTGRASTPFEPDDVMSVVDALSVRTAEGVVIPAIGSPWLVVTPVGGPTVQAGPSWRIRSAIEVATGARVREELAGGASSLWFAQSAGMADSLAGVDLAAVPVCVDQDWAVLEACLTGAASVSLHPDHNLSYDPIGAALQRKTAIDTGDFDAVVAAASRLRVRGLVVDGTAAANRGAGDVAELAYVLAAAAHLLRTGDRAGIPAARVAAMMEFRVVATGEFFVSLTKVRAIRLCWQRICAVSGAATAPARIHAVTSRSHLWSQDPHSNLLRTTTAALAAVVGGVDALTVLPFDAAAGSGGMLGRRLARNVSHLLAGESHVRRDDAAAGAFALEELTRRIAVAAWAQFAAIERAGGIDTSLGGLSDSWGQAAAVRAREIADGDRTVVGVNAFAAAR